MTPYEAFRRRRHGIGSTPAVGVIVAVAVVIGIVGYYAGTSGKSPQTAGTTTVMSTVTSTVTAGGGATTSTVTSVTTVGGGTATATATTTSTVASVTTVTSTVAVGSTTVRGVPDDDGDGV
jgi:hypothetical protein